MPKGELPDAARVLPPAGQKVWLKAFDEAKTQGLPEDEASAFAWAAVKQAGYSKKSNGKWSKYMDMKTDFMLNDDGSFELGVPLIKIDVKKRQVSGFATLNNVDEAHDVLEAEASLEAFTKWFGNIREMHQKEAVGKAVDWKEDTYTDPETGEEYKGIWVTAKISKGAENTWQKVLDGTLSGFSVGGATLEKERDLVKNGDETIPVWRITKYRLNELSLVDSPCNRLAAISLIKSVDGNPEFGDTIADEAIEKSYDGETGEFVDLSPAMRTVITALEGWRDEAINNNADYAVARASEILAGVRSSCCSEESAAKYYAEESEESEGGTMTDVEKSGDALQENENSDNTSVLLSEDDKSIFRKFIDFVKSDNADVSGETEEALNKNEEGETPEMNTEELNKAIDEKAEELTKSVDTKFDQVAESLTKMTELLGKVATTEAVEEIKKGFDEKLEALTGRLETVETAGAVQKSGDSEKKPEDKIEKGEEGFWAGSLLPDFVLQKG